jgi:hypothetical protein
MTQKEMASAILNRLTDALSGAVSNLSISEDQVFDEIDLQRADLIHKYDGTKKLDTAFLEQTVCDIEVICRPCAKACRILPETFFPKTGADTISTGLSSFGSSGGKISLEPEIPSLKIPKLLSGFDRKSLSYVGLSNKREDFIVYFDMNSIGIHKRRMRTKHAPFAWVDTNTCSENMMTIYLFNLGKYNSIKFLTVRGMFEHPAYLHSLDPKLRDREYPAPGHLKNMIIDALTEKYVRYYRQANVPSYLVSNEQRDLKL